MVIRRSSALFAICSLLVVQIALSPPANALPGDLDPSFGDAGLVYTEFYGEAYGMALQTDGKIVTVGGHDYSSQSFALARFNVNGGLDPSFGEGGMLSTGFGGGQANYQRFTAAFDVAIQTDGKIVAAGTTGKNPTGYISGNRFALARYEADGTLDASFGTSGRVRTGFGSGHGGATALGVAIQPDGKIVAAGYARKGFAIVRYNPDGSLDQSFGSGGRLRTKAFDGVRGRSFVDVALQTDGAIVAVGTYSDDDGYHALLARFLADGSADDTFGTDGAVIASDKRSTQRASLMIQPDGKFVVVAGRLLLRFDQDGTPDASFADDGQALMPTQLGTLAAALQSDGKVVVTFFGHDFLSITIRRYDPEGALDPTFGDDGAVRTGLGYTPAAYAVAIQPDGKIVVAGTDDNTNIDGAFALARYLAA